MTEETIRLNWEPCCYYRKGTLADLSCVCCTSQYWYRFGFGKSPNQSLLSLFLSNRMRRREERGSQSKWLSILWRGNNLFLFLLPVCLKKRGFWGGKEKDKKSADFLVRATVQYSQLSISYVEMLTTIYRVVPGTACTQCIGSWLYLQYLTVVVSVCMQDTG